MTNSIADDVVLELSFRCTQLNYFESFCGPSTVLDVQYTQHESDFPTPHSRTEVIHGTANPVYRTAVRFTSNEEIGSSTKLGFVVYRVTRTKTEAEKMEILGSCFCFVGDLIQLQHELTLHLQNNGDFTGCLHLSLVRQKIAAIEPKKNKSGRTIVSIDDSLAESVKPASERTSQFGTLSTSAMLQSIYNVREVLARTYSFPMEHHGSVSAEELMVESLLSFHIPILYLKMCIEEESRHIKKLEAMGKLSNIWETTREKKMSQHQVYLDRYQDRLSFLEDRNHEPYFKKSTNKGLEKLDFTPINLHLQRLRVENVGKSSQLRQNFSESPVHDEPTFSSSTSWSEYDIITVGATAIHSMGFKQGGLLTQLINFDEGGKSKKSLPVHHLFHCLKCGRTVNEEEQLLNSLCEQIKYQIKKLLVLTEQLSCKSPFDVYSSDKVTTSHESLATLSSKVCEFATRCESTTNTTAVVSLYEARSAYKPFHPSYTHGPPSSSHHESGVELNGKDGNVAFSSQKQQVVEKSPSELWEEEIVSLKSLLAEVVKSVHRIITPDLEESFLRGEVSTYAQYQVASRDLTSLQNQVENVFSLCVSGLLFKDFHSSSNSIDPELLYRRNAVFSQSLSLCACAVATSIASSLHDEQILSQYAHLGILVQVESLLSTYGSELGMLQDYAVGIMDLCNVTFKCERASAQSLASTSDAGVADKYLPSLDGSLDAVTVTLYFDEASFKMLPAELQRGKLIKVYPVIFNIGINEEQTLAEKFGSTTLQEYLNIEATNKILQYYDSVRDHSPSVISGPRRHANSIIKRDTREKSASSNSERKKAAIFNATDEPRSVMEMLNSLNVAVRSKKSKNVEILQLASDICHRMHGVRITSCKSAKDRTAMSVTLEQARILVNNQGMARGVFNQALNCMRSEGTRRENTKKNTGCSKYAFTSVQLMTFPKHYRPPEGTFGKGET